MKIALITGITGQDGSYLAEFLIKKEYTVHGIIRRKSYENFKNIEHLLDKLNLHYGDLTDSLFIVNLINEIKPDEIYNLGAQTFVELSFKNPLYTFQANTIAVINILEAIRVSEKKIKLYQASTSEMFGLVQEIPQNEETKFYPRSPYAVSKLAAHWMVKNYREAYNIFGCNGILFNHESPRRSIDFVTQKIVTNMKKVKNGEIDFFELGNLNSKRDWGYSEDFVEAMWIILQQTEPDDYVASTGEMYSVRDFIKEVAKNLEMEIEFKGENINEVVVWKDKEIIKISEKFLRPSEVELLLGDSTKIKKIWEPKTKFKEIVKKMCE